MIDNLNTSKDHSEALKYAIILRRNGTICPAIDDLLGKFLYNIARWAVAEHDILWREKPDVVSDVALKVIMAVDKVDLEKSAPQILGYLRTAAKNAHKNILEANACQKRTAELVDVDVVTIATDIRGQRIYR
jgi:hypothetical protein